MSTETTVQNLKINKLTKAQFDTITPSATEAYELTDLSSILDGKLQNTATGTNSLTILGAAASSNNAINIGASSSAGAYGCALGHSSTTTGGSAIAIGRNTEATGTASSAIGVGAKALANYSIQLGYGSTSTTRTFSVGFYNGAASDAKNYQLLNGSTGKIPSDRLDIATSVSSSSTNAEVVGAKLFYDTVGNIESALNTINSGS